MLKNTFEKGHFLLVPSFAGPVLSGLWASKENEHYTIRKGHGIKLYIVKW